MQSGSSIGLFLPLVLLAGAFWLLVVRPARSRQKAAQAVVARVAPGVRVMTTAGLFGTVTAVEGDQIDLEIAPGVTVRYMAAAVARIETEPQPGSGTQDPAQPSLSSDDTPADEPG